MTRIQVGNIPNELKALPQWVCWEAVPKENSKLDKIPIDPRTGKYASHSNPSTWGTYGEAVDRWKNNPGKLAGIGFVFSENTPYAGVDIDDCRDPETGKFTDLAARMIRTLNSYCEVSPSGQGVKIFVRASLPDGAPKGGRKDESVGIEMYDKLRFFTLTGNTVNGFPRTIEKRDEEFKALYAEYFGTPVNRIEEVSADTDGVAWSRKIEDLPVKARIKGLIQDGENVGRRSNAIMSVVNALVKARLTRTDIFHIFERYAIGEKWRKQHKGKAKWLDNHIDKALRRHPPSQAKSRALEKPSHIEIARKVVALIGPANILESNQATWIWRNGVWRKLDSRELKQRVHRETDQLSKNLVDSVCDLVRTEVFRSEHRFDTNRNIVNVLNGELHWTNDKWELKPHQRESYCTTQIPVEYDSKATAPRFLLFLDEIFAPDEDKHEKAHIVLEVIGYTLLASCVYEKFMILIGPGANGKSVLMSTVAALVGSEQVAAVQPSQFENRFQRAHLHGKLVNLVTEIAEGHEIADAQLKAIVSGELTTAEHKLQRPFEFSPFATCWFGTNHMPHTRDFSEALFRRALILTFNRKFEEHEQDKHLREKLRAELPGILNLALMAIAGVFRRGEFTKANSVESMKKEWRLDCDQVAQFIEDKCVLSADRQETSHGLYSVYKSWTEEVGVRRPLNRKNLTLRLARLGAEPFKGTGGMRLICGIGLKS